MIKESNIEWNLLTALDLLTLLSSLVNNLSEGIHSNKCKNCNFYLEYIPATNNYLVFKCKKSVKKSIKTV